MVSRIVCPKCKTWDKMKLVKPFGKEGIWSACENCDFMQLMPNIPKVKQMWAVQVFFNKLLSHMAVCGELDVKDMLNYKLEMFWEIWDSKFEME